MKNSEKGKKDFQKWKKSVDEKLLMLFSTDEEKILMIKTMVGAALCMSEFIHKHRDFLNIPTEVLYQIGLTITNADAMLWQHQNDKPVYSCKDISGEPDIQKKIVIQFRALEESLKDRGLI